jgi:Tfp pilus assembly protein PilO
LHDIQITPMEKSAGSFDQLQLDLTAKTYRYLDDDELAAAEAERRKDDQAKRHGAGS